MEEKSIWSIAALPGIIVAAVSIAYQMICFWCGSIESLIAQSILSMVLWALKFGLSLYLTYYFMRKFSFSSQNCDRREIFKFGRILALLSAFVYSAFYFVYAQFIAPELFSDAIQVVIDSYSQVMPQDAIDDIQNMAVDMPKMAFFTNLIYCWLFGTVLAAIFSSALTRNPFRKDGSNSIDEQ